jgi:glutamine synthetase type III
MPLRVKACLAQVQMRLWELGVPIVTVHNEVAPGQFEMAPSFERASVASDHNMITMQVLLEESERHGLACLLHEKPFSRYVNGSGKHTNWSLATNEGENLFAPGDDPSQHTQFLFFLAAFIRAAHVHTDVLRMSIAVPGNEFRLGGMEAPPAIISVFLGQFLEQVVNRLVGEAPVSPSVSPVVPEAHPQAPHIPLHAQHTQSPPSAPIALPSASASASASQPIPVSQSPSIPLATSPSHALASSPAPGGPGKYLDLGLSSLPKVQLDGSDRNRTSPLAFVGSRFEFRAVGSSQNTAWPITALNTIMAESLGVLCDALQAKIDQGAAPRDALAAVIHSTLKAHLPIVYNGDCYEVEYVEEMAKKRGLPNIPSTPAALVTFNTLKNQQLFAKANVMTPPELEARVHVMA